MSIDKIITVAIFLGFVLLGLVQTIATFSVEEYSGRWIHIGVTSKTVSRFGFLRCYTMDITKTENNSFSSVYTFTLSGIKFREPGSGWVSHNEITQSSNIIKSEYSASIVHSYNNGQDLILQPKYSSTAYRLISRSMDASPEAIAALEKIGKDYGVSIAWTNNKDCAEA